MKNLNLFLSAILISFYSLFAYADEDALRFVEHNVARTVLEQHFGHITDDFSSNFNVKYDDESILKLAISEYNDMLTKNGGFVSATGVADMCLTVFEEVLEPKNSNTESDSVVDKCYAFIKDLITTPEQMSDSVSDCIYKVSMAPDKFHIKYENKDTKHGFIRHCDNYIGWRTLNPGNLVDSPYKCAKIGGQAVFVSEEIGFKALAYLLTESDLYKNSTLRQKISLYARSSSSEYLAFLTGQGIDIDKKLSTFKDDPKELKKLIEAMARKEGWFNGINKCRGYENATNVKDKKGIEYF